jgi:PAS domain S-box-containing protein
MNVSKGSITKGGGEMGERILAFDWSKTSVGPMDTWPQSLRTTLSILLKSKFPMFLFWGPDFICFYNDAFRPSLGNEGKHPEALGTAGKEVWQEIWHIIFPLIDQVLTGGEATWEEDQLIPIYRNGKMEDVYWTFSYSPVDDESGKVGGVLVICNETTEKVIASMQQENYLQNAINIADLGTFNIDAATLAGSYSEKIMDWFELDSQHQPIEKIAAKVHPEDRQQVLQSITASLESEEKSYHDINYRLISAREGNFRYLRSIGKTLFTAEGTPHSIIGIVQDITAQMLSHTKLTESEERYRTLIEQATVATGIYVGREMKIEYANEAMLKVMDKESTVIGLPFKEAIPELEGQSFFELLDRVYTTGVTYHGKEDRADLIIGGKKQTFYFNFSYKPLLNQNGQIWGILNMAVDVTEQVETRKRIEESESRFSHMIKQAPVAITLTRGRDLVIEHINTSMLRVLGKACMENVLGKKMIEVLPEIEGQHILQIAVHVFDTGEAFTGNEMPVSLKLKDKEELHYFNISYTPLVENGEVTGVIHVAVDVSEQVLARQKVEESQQALEAKNLQLIRINNDLDNFIYTASHDLKAPISNIEALLHALLRVLPAEMMAAELPKEITAMMQESVERFKKTIESLTEVVKLQKENSQEAVKVNLKAVIKNVRLDLEQLIKSSGAQIETDVADSVFIHFSEKNFRSVVYNLISNAIKYQAPDRVPQVQISCKSEPGYLVLSVQDNGLGIVPRHMNQLFTMFKRFHSHVEGTGIGLYMVKKMIDNAGGKIEVESKPGKGTIFHVYFKSDGSIDIPQL